ncbi:SDR family oxidoreductase [Magnetospira sp. QH-2]|uniref:SDR family oxidoreductase n=1 Tax=Magnetospira sp. (strain QH-2) TaxID=1288970 RepID=UPI0003E81132|nr:SDR family oxidoreductase [Magnetospira sp. QH-2]CCQ74044.1 Short chain dehydrogenase [Magnetospira sp. QH-2]
MPTVLITGAGNGIGLEFARQCAADGWRVLATCRQPKKAKALKAIEGDVVIRDMDVLDFDRVHGLAKLWKKESIDLLLLNAGVYGPRPCTLGGLDYKAWEEVLWTNLMAPVKVAEAFLDHVARSEGRQIAALSSKMGSMSDNSSGGSYIYRTSKAALNAAMKSLSVDLLKRDVCVTMLHPGWVRTDMGGPNALIDVDESVSGLRKVLSKPAGELNGRFYNYDGQPIPW